MSEMVGKGPDARIVKNLIRVHLNGELLVLQVADVCGFGGINPVDIETVLRRNGIRHLDHCGDIRRHPAADHALVSGLD